MAMLANTAALKLAVRLKSMRCVIIGVPIKCGLPCPKLAANTTDGADIMANASNVVATVAVVAVIV